MSLLGSIAGSVGSSLLGSAGKSLLGAAGGGLFSKAIGAIGGLFGKHNRESLKSELGRLGKLAQLFGEEGLKFENIEAKEDATATKEGEVVTNLDKVLQLALHAADTFSSAHAKATNVIGNALDEPSPVADQEAIQSEVKEMNNLSQAMGGDGVSGLDPESGKTKGEVQKALASAQGDFMNQVQDNIETNANGKGWVSYNPDQLRFLEEGLRRRDESKLEMEAAAAKQTAKTVAEILMSTLEHSIGAQDEHNVQTMNCRFGPILDPLAPDGFGVNYENAGVDITVTGYEPKPMSKYPQIPHYTTEVGKSGVYVAVVPKVKYGPALIGRHGFSPTFCSGYSGAVAKNMYPDLTKLKAPTTSGGAPAQMAQPSDWVDPTTSEYISSFNETNKARNLGSADNGQISAIGLVQSYVNHLVYGGPGQSATSKRTWEDFYPRTCEGGYGEGKLGPVDWVYPYSDTTLGDDPGLDENEFRQVEHMWGLGTELDRYGIGCDQSGYSFHMQTNLRAKPTEATATAGSVWGVTAYSYAPDKLSQTEKIMRMAGTADSVDDPSKIVRTIYSQTSQTAINTLPFRKVCKGLITAGEYRESIGGTDATKGLFADFARIDAGNNVGLWTVGPSTGTTIVANTSSTEHTIASALASTAYCQPGVGYACAMNTADEWAGKPTGEFFGLPGSKPICGSIAHGLTGWYEGYRMRHKMDKVSNDKARPVWMVEDPDMGQPRQLHLTITGMADLERAAHINATMKEVGVGERLMNTWNEIYGDDGSVQHPDYLSELHGAMMNSGKFDVKYPGFVNNDSYVFRNAAVLPGLVGDAGRAFTLGRNTSDRASSLASGVPVARLSPSKWTTPYCQSFSDLGSTKTKTAESIHVAEIVEHVVPGQTTNMTGFETLVTSGISATEIPTVQGTAVTYYADVREWMIPPSSNYYNGFTGGAGMSNVGIGKNIGADVTSGKFTGFKPVALASGGYSLSSGLIPAFTSTSLYEFDDGSPISLNGVEPVRDVDKGSWRQRAVLQPQEHSFCADVTPAMSPHYQMRCLESTAAALGEISFTDAAMLGMPADSKPKDFYQKLKGIYLNGQFPNEKLVFNASSPGVGVTRYLVEAGTANPDPTLTASGNGMPVFPSYIPNQMANRGWQRQVDFKKGVIAAPTLSTPNPDGTFEMVTWTGGGEILYPGESSPADSDSIATIAGEIVYRLKRPIGPCLKLANDGLMDRVLFPRHGGDSDKIAPLVYGEPTYGVHIPLPNVYSPSSPYGQWVSDNLNKNLQSTMFRSGRGGPPAPGVVNVEGAGSRAYPQLNGWRSGYFLGGIGTGGARGVIDDHIDNYTQTSIENTQFGVTLVAMAVRGAPTLATASQPQLEAIVNTGLGRIYDVKRSILVPTEIIGATQKGDTNPGCGVTQWMSYGGSFDNGQNKLSQVIRAMTGFQRGKLEIKYSAYINIATEVPTGYYPVVWCFSDPDNALPNGAKLSHYRADVGTLMAGCDRRTPHTQGIGKGPLSWGSSDTAPTYNAESSTLAWSIESTKDDDFYMIGDTSGSKYSRTKTSAGPMILSINESIPPWEVCESFSELPGGPENWARSGITKTGDIKGILTYKKSAHRKLIEVSEDLARNGVWPEFQEEAMTEGVEVGSSFFDFVSDHTQFERQRILKQIMNG